MKIYLLFVLTISMLLGLSGCDLLHTTHLSPVNHAAPVVAGQGQVRAGASRMTNTWGGFAQGWFAPINHLVVNAEAGTTHEIREGIYSSIFTPPRYERNLGQGKTFGAGAGYWRMFGQHGLCLTMGMNYDSYQTRYRFAPNEYSPFVTDESARYNMLRPYLQANYYYHMPQADNPIQAGFLVGLKVNKILPQQMTLRNNLSQDGQGWAVLENFNTADRRVIVYQLNFQMRFSYKMLTAETGPQFNIQFKQDNNHYRIPFSSFQASLGFILGWKKGQAAPAQ